MPVIHSCHFPLFPSPSLSIPPAPLSCLLFVPPSPLSSSSSSLLPLSLFLTLQLWDLNANDMYEEEGLFQVEGLCQKVITEHNGPVKVEFLYITPSSFR